jgi:hypothetical protein
MPTVILVRPVAPSPVPRAPREQPWVTLDLSRLDPALLRALGL